MSTDADELIRTATDHYLHGRYRDAIACGQAALDRLRPDGSATGDAGRVRAIEILILATEPWWRAEADQDDGLALPELVARAGSAAARVGDPVLIAIAWCLRGYLHVVSDSLELGVEAFGEALRSARLGDDQLVELTAMTELAHATIGRDFDAGYTQLRAAVGLAQQLRTTPMAAFRTARLDGLIGVAEFDAGQFDAAESWLRQALAKLEQVGARDQVATMANYLAQLLITTGRFEQAQTLLAARLDDLRDLPLASAHRAYNLGLLGKLYLEWNQPNDARDSILQAWQQIQDTGHASIRPLLRNYYAELLMHPSNSDADLVAAEQLLAETVKECQDTGFVRSEVVARSMLGDVAARRGELGAARAHSTAAVDRLDRAGTLPAVRAEEIYHIHAQILERDHDPEAAHWRQRARDLLDAKAHTIGDEGVRRLFLERVNVIRAILAGPPGSPVTATEASTRRRLAP
jgi:tetratricopeptide (TPR) repeat protein